MDIKEKFKVVYYQDALTFLERMDIKTRTKILYNIDRARYTLNPKLFKKLTGSDIWEFRSLYNGKQYRLLAFWDKSGETEVLVIVTHGFIKKTEKAPVKEIEHVKRVMKEYFNK